MHFWEKLQRFYYLLQNDSDSLNKAVEMSKKLEDKVQGLVRLAVNSSINNPESHSLVLDKLGSCIFRHCESGGDFALLFSKGKFNPKGWGKEFIDGVEALRYGNLKEAERLLARTLWLNDRDSQIEFLYTLLMENMVGGDSVDEFYSRVLDSVIKKFDGRLDEIVGSQNQVVKLDNNGNFIFKISSDVEGLRREYDITTRIYKFFQEHMYFENEIEMGDEGIRIVKPMTLLDKIPSKLISINGKNTNGKSSEGEEQGCLVTFHAGGKSVKDEYGIVPDDVVKKTLDKLVRFHHVLVAKKEFSDIPDKDAELREKIKSVFEYNFVDDLFDYISMIRNRNIMLFKGDGMNLMDAYKIGEKSFNPYLINGDFHFGNVIYNEQTDEFTFLDFGDVGVGSVFLDSARLIGGFDKKLEQERSIYWDYFVNKFMFELGKDRIYENVFSGKDFRILFGKEFVDKFKTKKVYVRKTQPPYDFCKGLSCFDSKPYETIRDVSVEPGLINKGLISNMPKVKSKVYSEMRDILKLMQGYASVIDTLRVGRYKHLRGLNWNESEDRIRESVNYLDSITDSHLLSGVNVKEIIPTTH